MNDGEVLLKWGLFGVNFFIVILIVVVIYYEVICIGGLFSVRGCNVGGRGL